MAERNSALSRTLFIGGPQRIGKSYVANALSKRIGGHIVSTDSIASAAGAICTDPDNDMFLIQKELASLPDEEWITTYSTSTDSVINIQRRATRAFWPAVAAFCKSFEHDAHIHIVEGVIIQPLHLALLPERPPHAIFVGNTSETHAEAMIKHARTTGHDWMKAQGYSEARVRAMAVFVREFSLYFKEQAEAYGFPYVELGDDDFLSSVDRAVATLLS